MRMGKLIALLVLVVSAIPVMALDHIRFNGEVYDLQDIKSENENEDVRVYIPSKEKMDKWTKMIVLQAYPDILDPTQAATYLRNSHRVSSAPDVGELIVSKRGVILPMILLNTDENGLVYEQNIIRFETGKTAGIVGVQYVERFAMSSHLPKQSEVESIKKRQSRLIQLIKKLDIPVLMKEKK